MTSHYEVIRHSSPLPISPQSTLVWCGMDSKLSNIVYTQDSDGLLRMMDPKNFSWTTICMTMNMCNSSADFCWMVSMWGCEQFRYIMCKGANFPPTLPKPVITSSAMKLPLLQLDQDKGRFQEEFWRKNLAYTAHQFANTSSDIMIEASEINKLHTEMKRKIMMMFAYACQNNEHQQALDVCKMMPDIATLQLAIKYASSKDMRSLTEKITEMARQRKQMEQKAEEEDFERLMTSSLDNDDVTTSLSSKRFSIGRKRPSLSAMSMDVNTSINDEEPSFNGNEVPSKKRRSINPFKKKNQNPDLQSQNVVEATPSSNGSLDSLKRAGSEKKKTTMSAFITNNKNKELSSVKKTTNKMQATLSLFKKKSADNEKVEENKKRLEKTNGGQSLVSFIEENMESCMLENDDLDEDDCRKLLIKRYRQMKKMQNNEDGVNEER